MLYYAVFPCCRKFYCPITFIVREWCERLVCTSHPKAGVIFPLNMVWTVEIASLVWHLHFGGEGRGGGMGEGGMIVLHRDEHIVYSLCMNCMLHMHSRK